jgi:AcrR family transcriptional regulator
MLVFWDGPYFLVDTALFRCYSFIVDRLSITFETMNKPFSPAKKDKLANRIAAQAKSLFLKEGIAQVKMTDVAKACHLGVATLYRYFRLKKNLVIASGVLLWQEEYEAFAEISVNCEAEKLNGAASLRKLMLHFYDVFRTRKEFFLFVRDFDVFCHQEKVKPSELVAYDQNFLRLRDLFIATGKRGEADGSLRQVPNFETIYYAFSRAVLGLGEKLIGESAIVESDEQGDSEAQILSLIDVLTGYLTR